MSEKKVKIEIELDPELKIGIDIISKAFNWTPGKFIEYCIRRDIEYVRGYAGLDSSYSSDLEQHFHLKKIDMNKLTELTSVEGIL